MSDPEKLSAHLSVPEFLITQHRPLAAAQEEAWRGSPEVQANARRFAAIAFEPLRALLGPLIVSSGFRCEAVNTAVGGSGSKPGQKPSAHMTGRAADLVPSKVGLVDATAKVREAMRAGALPGIDKVIFEFGRWLHVQIAQPGEKPHSVCLMTFDGASYPAFDVADPRVVARRAA